MQLNIWTILAVAAVAGTVIYMAVGGSGVCLT